MEKTTRSTNVGGQTQKRPFFSERQHFHQKQNNSNITFAFIQKQYNAQKLQAKEILLQNQALKQRKNNQLIKIRHQNNEKTFQMQQIQLIIKKNVDLKKTIDCLKKQKDEIIQAKENKIQEIFLIDKNKSATFKMIKQLKMRNQLKLQKKQRLNQIYNQLKTHQHNLVYKQISIRQKIQNEQHQNKESKENLKVVNNLQISLTQAIKQKKQKIKQATQDYFEIGLKLKNATKIIQKTKDQIVSIKIESANTFVNCRRICQQNNKLECKLQALMQHLSMLKKANKKLQMILNID